MGNEDWCIPLNSLEQFLAMRCWIRWYDNCKGARDEVSLDKLGLYSLTDLAK